MNRRRGAIAVWVLAVALVLTPFPASWVESVYSRGMYRLIQPVFATISGVVPFALLDLVLLSAIGASLWWIGRGVFSPRQHGLASLGRLATLWAAIGIVFALTWGLNFRRVALRESSRFDETRLTPEALRALAVRTVQTLNETRRQLPPTWPTEAAMRDTVGQLFGEAAEALTGWHPALSRPKSSLLQWYMPRIAMNGYYLSLLHEVALNPELLDFERPYVLAHEWAHGLGHANESEAAYVGWLACDRGPAWARYGAWMRILDYLRDDLPRDERRAIFGALDSAVLADIDARYARRRRHFQPRLRRFNEAVQDRAAAVVRIEPSQRDYDLVIQLILGFAGDSAHRVQVPVGAPEVRDTVGDHRR